MKKRKIMRAAEAVILAALLVLSMTACGSESGSQSGNTGASSLVADESDVHIEVLDKTEASIPIEEAVTLSPTGSDISITKGGAYILSGDYTECMINIAAPEEENVCLYLSGANITNSDGSCIYAKSAKNLYITSVEGTVNTLTDGSSYVLETDSDEPNATIFSRCDLFLMGTGTLSIDANYNNAVRSKDNLRIANGIYSITSVNNAISGKDSLTIAGGTFTIDAGGCAFKATEADEVDKGWISITGGTIDAVCAQDGIEAETTIYIGGGDITLQTGGGSQNTSFDDNWGSWGSRGDPFNSQNSSEEGTSAKAVKADGGIIIENTTLTIDSSDDAIHTNGSIWIRGGTLEISSGDDGMHADTLLSVSGGMVMISQSYEGLEAASISISGGELDITSNDDTLNAAGGNDGSSLNGRPGQNNFSKEKNGAYYINISGGNLTLTPGSDGIDSNGSITMSGGYTVVNAASGSVEVPVDYNGTFVATGGTLLAAGGTQMAQNIDSSSTQGGLLYVFGNASAGAEVILADASGETIAQFTPSQDFACVLISCPALTSSGSYTLKVGDESYAFEMNGTATTIGTSGGMGMGGHGQHRDDFSMPPGGMGGDKPGGGMGGGRGGDMGGDPFGQQGGGAAA